jgi:hypothetical protein
MSVEGAFGADVDYAVLEKLYSTAPQAARGRYSPAVCVGTRRQRVEGKPAAEHVSTFYVERQNLTMRMGMRRFTRLTNGFSKKLESHCDALALYFFHFNWCRIHKTLRVTPAMVAGLFATVLDWTPVLDAIDAANAPKPRGPYKKRISN